ncbi:DoxX family protein [Alteriqipengyuania sp. WL0013]|uniref:DoxX family protein n=1 Tax=Alteriqipengyuania sp. WL0013 TaxID=3110773 RepID=UPI002C12A649|nr:DoxX family protein [Alteriqipengyuania sp. WL0013]MEB3416866.1 DoxX family protein [Alteriqipengyuania sp. WL0013]
MADRVENTDPKRRAKMVTRIIIALLYAAAGVLHLVSPQPFLSITPGWVPYPDAVVALTGIAELLGAVALAQPFSPRLVHWGAWGLAAYAVCVFPANINHFAMDMAREDGGAGLAYHLPRMVAQPLLVALTLWAGNVRVGRGRREDPPTP